MTRLPVDIQTQGSRAAAPAGIEYSSTTTQHGVVSAWCGLANSEELLPVGKVAARTRRAPVDGLRAAASRP